MNKEEKTKLNRELIKETPKIELENILDKIGCIGLEKEIAEKRIIEKKTPLDICCDLNISESTYYRNFNNILIKIHKVLKYI